MKEDEEQYEVFEELCDLGFGHFAKTVKARVIDPDLAREYGCDLVALKIPYPEKARLIKKDLEMNILIHDRMREIESPHLVPFYGFDTYKNSIVLAFQYMPGGNLRKKMGRNRPMAEQDVLDLAIGILNGLDILHKGDILHRDIKPENILLNGDIPALCDFGIARRLTANKLVSSGSGTLPYASPEVLGKRDATFSSDIWSLGVTLYEMLTGKLPFGDEAEYLVICNAILNEKHAPVCELRPQMDKELGRVIEKTLRKEHSERYATAEDMLDALRSLNAGQNPGIAPGPLKKQGESHTGKRTREQDIATEMEKIRLMRGHDDVSEKEAKIKALLEKYPDEWKLWQFLGEFYNRCYRFGEAVEAFKRGVALSPGNGVLHWNVALTYHKLKKKTYALHHLKKALSIGLAPGQKRHAEILLEILRSR